MGQTPFQARYTIGSVTEITPGILWELIGDVFDYSFQSFGPANATVGDLVFDEGTSDGVVNRWRVTQIVSTGVPNPTSLTVRVVYDEPGSPAGLFGEPVPCDGVICDKTALYGFSQQPALSWVGISETIKSAILNNDERRIDASIGTAIGPQGPQGLGFQGFTGIQGVAGANGIQGVAGANGNAGVQGFTGNDGVQGVAGANGSVGVQGSMGAQGFMGNAGVQGVAGANGNAGVQGVAGTNGNAGVQGVAGADGVQGITGSNGGAGVQGFTGANGNNGVQGFTGANGNAGVQGVAGADGAAGVQGFTGANGVQGSMGPQGFTGDAGVQGVAGSQGFNGFQGYQGTFGPSYQVYYADSTAGQEVMVIATNTGITYADGGVGVGTGTFTIPAGVHIVSAKIRVKTASAKTSQYIISYSDNGYTGIMNQGALPSASTFPPFCTAWKETTNASKGVNALPNNNTSIILSNLNDVGETYIIRLNF
jgi:hypothetical protein